MSVLDNPIPQPPVPPAVRAAGQLKVTTRQTYNRLVEAFNQGAAMFWQNPTATPAEIAAALGPQAVEIFQLHGMIGQLLAQVKPEAIAPGLAAVGEFTYNEDGSVTIVEPPEVPANPAE